MSKPAKYTLFVGAFVFAFTGVMHAAEPVLREFDAEKLNEYRQKDEYIYEEGIRFNIWDYLQRILQKFLNWLFKNFDIPNVQIPDSEAYAGLVVWLVAGIAAAFLVYIIFKGKWAWIFKGKKFKKTEKDYTVYQEDIHSINFADEIELAVAQKDYRKATRLFYLKALKLMSDDGMIDWQLNKTNEDYRREIKSQAIRDEFDYLSLAFEYVWYGEFQPSEELFLQTFEKFRAFNRRFTQEPLKA